jgi:hypothetical protein
MPSPLERLTGAGKPLATEPPDPGEFEGLKRSGLARLKDSANPANALERVLISPTTPPTRSAWLHYVTQVFGRIIVTSSFRCCRTPWVWVLRSGGFSTSVIRFAISANTRETSTLMSALSRTSSLRVALLPRSSRTSNLLSNQLIIRNRGSSRGVGGGEHSLKRHRPWSSNTPRTPRTPEWR